jgi:hypothetical protein
MQGRKYHLRCVPVQSCWLYSIHPAMDVMAPRHMTQTLQYNLFFPKALHGMYVAHEQLSTDTYIIIDTIASCQYDDRYTAADVEANSLTAPLGEVTPGMLSARACGSVAPRIEKKSADLAGSTELYVAGYGTQLQCGT